MTYLHLGDLPRDPLSRLVRIDEVRREVLAELDGAFADAYYDARIQGLFEAALTFNFHGKYRALKMTRKVNNARHRMIRWNDQLDPSSSQYTG